MKNKTIKIFSSIDKLANHSAEFLRKKINEYQFNDSFSIAVSGGSTPKQIFKYIADNCSDKINWGKVKIFFGDERCVPPDSDESNFKMVNDSLLNFVPIPESNVYRIMGENDPIKEAERYGKIIHQNISKINNLPQFDIIMLGLGEDGHTASIFPEQIELFRSNKFCEVAVHSVSGQKRITMTGNIINNAKLVVFIVTGENKSKVISDLMISDNPDIVYPASLVSPTKGELIWLLDISAAQLLDSEIKRARVIL